MHLPLDGSTVNVALGGTTLTASGTFVGFIAKSIPVLQFFSLSVAILAGIATLTWTSIQIWKHFSRRAS